MRTFVLAAAMAMVGCASEPSGPAPQPAALQLDVVLGATGVTLYTSGSDLTAGTTCVGSANMFPALEGCVATSDAAGCTGSPAGTCLTDVSLEAASGTQHATITPASAASFAFSSDGTLVISGCGGTARIPLGAPLTASATATANVDAASNTITAAWQANTPQVLLRWTNTYVGDWCRTANSPYTLHASSALGSDTSVGITALAGPTIVPTMFGDARIWSSSSGTVTQTP